MSPDDFYEWHEEPPSALTPTSGAEIDYCTADVSGELL